MKIISRVYLFRLFIYLLPFVGQVVVAQPNASFEASRYKVCSGSEVVLFNTSVNAHQFQWKVNGIWHASGYHDTVVLYEPCYSRQTIQLIAEDTLLGLSDSTTSILEVFDSCALHLTIDYIKCPGDTITLNRHPESISGLWTFQPATPLISGCDTCRNLVFILTQLGTTVQIKNTYEGGCTQRTSYHYAFCNSSTLGTDTEESWEKSVRIYPNPVCDLLHIAFKEVTDRVELKLWNANGQMMLQQELHEVSETAIDVESLASGIYLLAIRSDNQVQYHRLSVR